MTATLDQYRPQGYSWFIQDMLLADDLLVLAGAPGGGKGQLCAAWASAITNGLPLAPGAPPAPKGSVVLISPEDRADTTLAGRYATVKADMRNVIDMSFPNKVNAFTVGGEHDNLPDLEAKIIATRDNPDKPDIRMVIIDGINACVGVSQTQKAIRRFVMEPLQQMARKYKIAIVLIAHFTKDGKVIAGSAAIVEAARLVLEIKVNGEVRTVTIRKSNVALTSAKLYFYITGQDIYTSIRYMRPEAAENYISQWQAEYGPRNYGQG